MNLNNSTSMTSAPKRERTALEIATARMAVLASAPARPSVPSPVVMAETRETFYRRKNGASRRTARKQFTCQQALCLAKVHPGEIYLDTQEVTAWPATMRICIACAEKAV